MTPQQAMAELANMAQLIEEEFPGPINNTDPAFLSVTREVVACPVVFEGLMEDGSYFRFRYRMDDYAVGFGWQSWADVQGVPQYQYRQSNYSGDEYAGSMDWEEAREIIKRHHAEWVNGGAL